jgi:hypothetical protein
MPTCLACAIGCFDADSKMEKGRAGLVCAELANARWWQRQQAEKGNRGFCCTTVGMFWALTVVSVCSDSCTEVKTAIEVSTGARRWTWQTGMGEAFVSRVGWGLIYCGRCMQQAFQYMQACSFRLQSAMKSNWTYGNEQIFSPVGD